jgi:hypothetical protein
MIVSEKKTIDEIVGLLNGAKKVFLTGCGDCAAACRVGGNEDMPELATKLEEKGITVLGWIVPEQSCNLLKTKIELKASEQLINDAEVIVSTACGAGIQTIGEILEQKNVIPGVNSQFLGTTKRAGDFKQQCLMCGDCVLGITCGICPQTHCAKSLMNGPCSGSVDGKCETYRDRDCAWHKIYGKLKEQGRLEAFEVRLPMKDYSNQKNQAELKVKPVKINTNRK